MRQCNRCSYMGCILRRQKYGETLGHWLWTVDLVSRPLRNAFNVRRQVNRFKEWLNTVDTSRLESIEIDGIDSRDYPDFCDAFVSYAEIDGKPLTESQLDVLNSDRDLVYNLTLSKLY